MLSVKRGLPLSRLLSHQKTDARSSRADFLRLQEESSSPILKVRKEMKTKEEENKEEAAKVDVKEKEEKSCPREGVPTSGSSIFTLRNSQSGVKTVARCLLAISITSQTYNVYFVFVINRTRGLNHHGEEVGAGIPGQRLWLLDTV